MTTDKRAHERIDGLEKVIKKHFEDHTLLEKVIRENTAMTKKIADNTSELVMLVRGAKGFRSFVVWATPIVIAIAAIVAWMKI